MDFAVYKEHFVLLTFAFIVFFPLQMMGGGCWIIVMNDIFYDV